MLIALAFAAVSCQKNNSGEDPDIPYEPQLCQHDSLAFVPSVQPTDSTCGVIEHYECPICHAMFLDVEKTCAIDDDVIWATSYVLGVDPYYETLDGIYIDINAEYKELSGADDNFAFSTIGLWLFKKVIEPKLGDMLKSLFAFHDGKGQGKTISPEVEAIVKQLSQIEGQLKRIADFFQEKEIREKVDKRQYELQALRAFTDPDFEILMGQIEGYSVNDVLPKERIDTIKMAVDDWYEHGITFIKEVGRSKDPYTNMTYMLEFINGTWSSSRTFPELYDHIAMKSTPWAIEGNKLREAMRAADVLSITKAYIMLSLYYQFHPRPLINKERYKEIKGLMVKYYNCMERFQVNPVEDNVIRWWWQDREGGSKLSEYALDKSIFHFEYLESNLDKAVKEKYDFSESYAGGLWRITEENIPVGSFLEFNDYKLLYKYLVDSKGELGKQKTLYEGIQSFGFTGLKSFKDGGRIVYRSKSHEFCGPRWEEKSEGYADYLYFSARGHYQNRHVFCLETALDEQAKRIDRYDKYYRKKAFFETYNPVPKKFKVIRLMDKGEKDGLEIQGISRSAKTDPYSPYISNPKE